MNDILINILVVEIIIIAIMLILNLWAKHRFYYYERILAGLIEEENKDRIKLEKR